MVEIREPLEDKDQSGDRMYGLIEQYAGDLDIVRIRKGGRVVPVSSLPLPEYFDLVRRMPYRRDTKPVEVVARPYYSLKYGPRLGIDCKKKAILLGAYCKRHGIPYRLVASSRRADRRMHHVFPQALMRTGAQTSPEWVNLDATYPHYRIGQQKTATAAEVL